MTTTDEGFSEMKHLLLSGCLVWEPVFRGMGMLEFNCLVARVLDRLETQGWRLVIDLAADHLEDGGEV